MIIGGGPKAWRRVPVEEPYPTLTPTSEADDGCVTKAEAAFVPSSSASAIDLYDGMMPILRSLVWITPRVQLDQLQSGVLPRRVGI